ncbi:MAG TPA: DUF5916 domain-containing protein [bacterium]|nr:DUF5916 domain-containing protein [bacterium]
MLARRLILALAIATPAMIACMMPGAPPAAGQRSDDASVKSIIAVRTNNHPRIDGLLSDAAWQRAPLVGGFITYSPEDGKAPSESTAFQVAYDDQALYVAMRMYDSQPDKIASRITRRDREQEADEAYVVIDSYHDHQTAYRFMVYASGTQRDVYYYNDTSSDASWDAVWESATAITKDGWTAEFRIPFDCLRFASGEKPVWGIAAGRYLSRKQEASRWPYIPESSGGFVSGLAHLQGLQNLRPPRQLELLPYGVSYRETKPEHPGGADQEDLVGNAGLDLRYGITPNITLTGTFNPDFGQVEADETVLNLSAFETFYPEKRPFFLEGSDIFGTRFNLFYSRRIGRAPSLRVPDAAYFTDMPTATTILGAAKVTGKTQGGTTIGILEAATQRERAKYADSQGASHQAVVEPEANYFVGRLKRDVLRNSYVGLMATAANQKTLNPAYTGGADWILRFHNGDFATYGQVLGSSTAPDQRGWGGFGRLAKEGGQNFRAYIETQYLDPKVDLNRIGFLTRNSLEEYTAWAQYRTTKKWWIVQRSWNGIYADRTEDLDGLMQNYGCDLESDIQLTNFWTADVGGWVDFGKTYFDWETRGGPPVPIPLGQSWRVGFITDQRKWWTLNPLAGGGDSWDGHFNSYDIEISLKPKSNVELSLEPSFRTERHISRWLKAIIDTSGNRQDIFGEQYNRRLQMTLRGTFTFSRDLTLQVYAQPFIAAVDYRRFKRLLPSETYEYVDKTVYDEAVERPDFNWKSFNSNVVLRWEYRPGSTLYLVWTQAREAHDTYGTLKLDRDLGGVFDAAAGNTFLVKANYRLMM